jgi:hypothetical protein
MLLNERVQQTRSRITDRANELVDVIQERQGEFRGQASEALDQGRGRLIAIEARALLGAREALGRARTVLGDRATFLVKGEEALTDALISLKASHDMTLPIEDFNDLSIKRIKPFLDELDGDDLRTIRAYEVTNKNRVTLVATLDRLLEDLADC